MEDFFSFNRVFLPIAFIVLVVVIAVYAKKTMFLNAGGSTRAMKKTILKYADEYKNYADYHRNLSLDQVFRELVGTKYKELLNQSNFYIDHVREMLLSEDVSKTGEHKRDIYCYVLVCLLLESDPVLELQRDEKSDKSFYYQRLSYYTYDMYWKLHDGQYGYLLYPKDETSTSFHYMSRIYDMKYHFDNYKEWEKRNRQS